MTFYLYMMDILILRTSGRGKSWRLKHLNESFVAFNAVRYANVLLIIGTIRNRCKCEPYSFWKILMTSLFAQGLMQIVSVK